MPFRLVTLTNGSDILVDRPIVLIGRHQECDVKLASSKISRKHCCIAQVNDYLVVRDLFSTNGVRINGVRVEEGILKAGDEVNIGQFRYRVATGETDHPSAAYLDQPMPRGAEDLGRLSSVDEPLALGGDDDAPVAAPATEQALVLPPVEVKDDRR